VSWRKSLGASLSAIVPVAQHDRGTARDPSIRLVQKHTCSFDAIQPSLFDPRIHHRIIAYSCLPSSHILTALLLSLHPPYLI
jgi:hypothetical protein